MPVKKFKPTSPARRFTTVLDLSDLTKKDPERSLIEVRKKNSGRNFNGHITVRHRGGGTRRQYRIIDFKRAKDAIPAKVAAIEYDPNRSAHIALLHYRDGEKRYILAPAGIKVGDVVESGPNADIKIGNTSAAGEHPGRHGRAQRRAASRTGRQARANGRRRSAADGKRRRVRAGPHALGRSS